MAAKQPTKKMGHKKRRELEEALRAVLRARFDVCAGERIGVAVSGGADSVALLRLFLELREQLGVVVCVAHFNHKLRGEASDADEKFVAKLAAQQARVRAIALQRAAAQKQVAGGTNAVGELDKIAGKLEEAQAAVRAAHAGF